jgi:hypothetical protein
VSGHAVAAPFPLAHEHPFALRESGAKKTGALCEPKILKGIAVRTTTPAAIHKN